MCKFTVFQYKRFCSYNSKYPNCISYSSDIRAMHHTSVLVYTKIFEAPCESDPAKTGPATPVPLLLGFRAGSEH